MAPRGARDAAGWWGKGMVTVRVMSPPPERHPRPAPSHIPHHLASPIPHPTPCIPHPTPCIPRHPKSHTRHRPITPHPAYPHPCIPTSYIPTSRTIPHSASPPDTDSLERWEAGVLDHGAGGQPKGVWSAQEVRWDRGTPGFLLCQRGLGDEPLAAAAAAAS